MKTNLPTLVCNIPEFQQDLKDCEFEKSIQFFRNKMDQEIENERIESAKVSKYMIKYLEMLQKVSKVQEMQLKFKQFKVDNHHFNKLPQVDKQKREKK